jgi:hypothetical protein
MPVTPFHYPIAYALHRLGKGLSMPGLVVGSFIPDIEVPLLGVLGGGLPDHFVLHSILGVLTIGVFISVFVTHFLCPPVVSSLFGIERAKLETACATNRTMVGSCLLGLFGHLLLDIPMHPYNPVLWPWVNPDAIVGILVLLFAQEGDLESGFMAANEFLSVVMLVPLLAIAIKHRHALWSGLWLDEPRKEHTVGNS